MGADSTEILGPVGNFGGILEIGVTAEITCISMMANAAASMTLGDFAVLSTLGVSVGAVGGLWVAGMLP